MNADNAEGEQHLLVHLCLSVAHNKAGSDR
jgi:hypothetical protein